MRSVFSYGNDVWIAGDNGNVYKTTKVNSPVSTYNIGTTLAVNSVHFVNSNIGFVCCDGGRIYKSIDGGLNWGFVSSWNYKFNSISFLDENNGIAVGDNGQMTSTIDGGNTWEVEYLGGTTRNLSKVKYFADGIIVVGEYGTILTKDNAGSWNSVVTRTDSDIRGISGELITARMSAAAADLSETT